MLVRFSFEKRFRVKTALRFFFSFFYFFLVSLFITYYISGRHSFFLSDVTESPSLVSSASSFNLRPTNTVGAPLFSPEIQSPHQQQREKDSSSLTYHQHPT